MIVIHGVARYGKVDGFDGEYLATRFHHVFGLPVIPLGSEWITGSDPRGTYGRACRLSMRSVMAAYVRTWGLVAAAVFGTLAIRGTTELLVPAITFAALAAATLGARRTTDSRELRRIELQRPVLGTPLDPLRLPRDTATLLLATLRARFDRHTSRAHAFVLYRLVAATSDGRDAESALITSEWLLDELTHVCVADGPYRTASMPVPAAEPPLLASYVLRPTRWRGVIATLCLWMVVMVALAPGGQLNVCMESKYDIARAGVKKLAFEAFPQWQATHPDRRCPTLGELVEYGGRMNDPFGTPYIIRCEALPAGAVGIAVWSLGENRTDEWGSGDDISSWAQ